MAKPLPPPERPIEQPKSGRSWIPIALLVLAGFVAYLALVFLTLGVFGPVLIIGGALLGIVMFHYVVWGWWLGKVIRDASDEDDL